MMWLFWWASQMMVAQRIERDRTSLLMAGVGFALASCQRPNWPGGPEDPGDEEENLPIG